MIIRSGLGILPFLFLVPSLADSDSLWFSSEDGNLPGTDFSSNEGALALGGPVLPSDSSSLLSDTSDSLFEDPQDTDLFLSANPDLIGDQSFEIADCSALASLPPVNGKSRAKRIDGVTSCRNPDLQLDPSSPLLHEDSDIIKHLEESWLTVPSRKELDHNRICRAITLNMLPWGACSNPGPVWTKRVNPMYPLMEDPRIVGIQLYDLEQCTILPAWLSVCPQLGSDFYCCRGFDKDAYSGRRSNMAGDFGEQCLPFSVLQGKPFFPL